MSSNFSNSTFASEDEIVVSETAKCGDMMLNISVPLSVAMSEPVPTDEEQSEAVSYEDEVPEEELFVTNYLSRNGNEISLVIHNAPEFSEDPSAEDLAWWESYALQTAKNAVRLRRDLLNYTTIEEFAKKILPLYLAAWETQTWVNLIPCYPEEILKRSDLYKKKYGQEERD